MRFRAPWSSHNFLFRPRGSRSRWRPSPQGEEPSPSHPPEPSGSVSDVGFPFLGLPKGGSSVTQIVQARWAYPLTGQWTFEESSSLGASRLPLMEPRSRAHVPTVSLCSVPSRTNHYTRFYRCVKKIFRILFHTLYSLRRNIQWLLRKRKGMVSHPISLIMLSRPCCRSRRGGFSL